MRDELHGTVMQQFEANTIMPDRQKLLLSALKRPSGSRKRMEGRLTALRQTISQQVGTAIDPTNVSIKNNVMESIAKEQRRSQ
jgi:hypothetical protein